MSYALSSSSKISAEPVEPEKRKPDYPVQFPDYVQNHDFYEVAQRAFHSVYDRVVANYHASRLNNHQCNHQRQLVKEFKENDPGQEIALKLLYVSSFVIGSNSRKPEDEPVVDGIKHAICDQMKPKYNGVRRSILQNLNSIASYAASEGRAYAAEKGYNP